MEFVVTVAAVNDIVAISSINVVIAVCVGLTRVDGPNLVIAVASKQLLVRSDTSEDLVIAALSVAVMTIADVGIVTEIDQVITVVCEASLIIPDAV